MKFYLMSIHPSIAQLTSKLAFVELSVILIPIYLWKKEFFVLAIFKLVLGHTALLESTKVVFFVCLFVCFVLFINFRVLNNSLVFHVVPFSGVLV